MPFPRVTRSILALSALAAGMSPAQAADGDWPHPFACGTVISVGDLPQAAGASSRNSAMSANGWIAATFSFDANPSGVGTVMRRDPATGVWTDIGFPTDPQYGFKYDKVDILVNTVGTVAITVQNPKAVPVGAGLELMAIRKVGDGDWTLPTGTTRISQAWQVETNGVRFLAGRANADGVDQPPQPGFWNADFTFTDMTAKLGSFGGNIDAMSGNQAVAIWAENQTDAEADLYRWSFISDVTAGTPTITSLFKRTAPTITQTIPLPEGGTAVDMHDGVLAGSTLYCAVARTADQDDTDVVLAVPVATISDFSTAVAIPRPRVGDLCMTLEGVNSSGRVVGMAGPFQVGTTSIDDAARLGYTWTEASGTKTLVELTGNLGFVQRHVGAVADDDSMLDGPNLIVRVPTVVISALDDAVSASDQTAVVRFTRSQGSTLLPLTLNVSAAIGITFTPSIITIPAGQVSVDVTLTVPDTVFNDQVISLAAPTPPFNPNNLFNQAKKAYNRGANTSVTITNSNVDFAGLNLSLKYVPIRVLPETLNGTIIGIPEVDWSTLGVNAANNPRIEETRISRDGWIAVLVVEESEATKPHHVLRRNPSDGVWTNLGRPVDASALATFAEDKDADLELSTGGWVSLIYWGETSPPNSRLYGPSASAWFAPIKGAEPLLVEGFDQNSSVPRAIAWTYNSANIGATVAASFTYDPETQQSTALASFFPFSATTYPHGIFSARLFNTRVAGNVSKQITPNFLSDAVLGEIGNTGGMIITPSADFPVPADVTGFIWNTDWEVQAINSTGVVYDVSSEPSSAHTDDGTPDAMAFRPFGGVLTIITPPVGFNTLYVSRMIDISDGSFLVSVNHITDQGVYDNGFQAKWTPAGGFVNLGSQFKDGHPDGEVTSGALDGALAINPYSGGGNSVSPIVAIPVPMVSATITASTATEGGSNASVRFTRTGSKMFPLTVRFTTDDVPNLVPTVGSIIPNDVTNIPYYEATIVAGATFVDVPMQAVNDTTVEGNQLAHVLLQPGGVTEPSTYNANVDERNHGLETYEFVDTTLAITVVSEDIIHAPVIGGLNALTVTEDAVTAGTLSLTATDIETPAAGLVWAITSGASKGVATLSDLSGGSSTLSYTPNPDEFGSDSVTITVTDGDAEVSTKIIAISITSVNDIPSFTKGANESVSEDAGVRSVSNWATAPIAGPANESAQTLTFTVTNDTNSLFSSQPAVLPNGTLSYTPAANAHGSAQVTVAINDSAGASSATQNFTITVASVSDLPVNTVLPLVAMTVNDAGVTNGTWNDLADSNPAPTTFTYQWFTNTVGIEIGTVAASETTATFAGAIAHTFVRCEVTATDSDIPPSQATVSSLWVKTNNALPTILVTPDTLNATEDTVASNALDITANDSDGASSSITWAIQSPATKGIVTRSPATGATTTLSFTPTANANGADSVTLRATDVEGGFVDVVVTIAITAVNDIPAFTAGANVTVGEDSLAFSAAWASALSAGPNETQTLSFGITNLDTTEQALFSSQPAIAANGTLSFTPALNANGSATMTVTMTDDGSAGGAALSTTGVALTITITAVNDAPVATAGAAVTVAEDSGAFSAAWATISAAPADESAQTVSFILSGVDSSLFTGQPAISPTGTLTFTPKLNANGVVSATVTPRDSLGLDGAPVSLSITISPVNDLPVNTVLPVIAMTGNNAGVTNGTWNDLLDGNPGVITFTYKWFGNTVGSGSGIGTEISGEIAATFVAAAPTHLFVRCEVTATDGGTPTTASAMVTSGWVKTHNVLPTITPSGAVSLLTNEDQNAPIPQVLTAADSDGDSALIVWSIVSPATKGTVVRTPDSGVSTTLTFIPQSNVIGVDSVTIRATDSAGGFVDKVVSITIAAVNDAPIFTKGANVSVLENAPAFIGAWATGMAPGPVAATDEAGQTVLFTVTAATPSLFEIQPAVSPSGELTFTPKADANGSSVIHVKLVDNGGTANQGLDTSAIQSATITVVAADQAPTFSQQPTQVITAAGQPVSFTVAAQGNPTPTLQWQRAEPLSSTFVNIPGATSATFTTAVITALDSGAQFRCVATNSESSVNSDPALLTVTATVVAPLITSQPEPVSCSAGSTFSLTIAVTGSPAPTVQWQRKVGLVFVDISGATSLTYTVDRSSTLQSGNYRCVATNSGGPATSDVAAVTVKVVTFPILKNVRLKAVGATPAGPTQAPTPAIFGLGVGDVVQYVEGVGYEAVGVDELLTVGKCYFLGNDVTPPLVLLSTYEFVTLTVPAPLVIEDEAWNIVAVTVSGILSLNGDPITPLELTEIQGITAVWLVDPVTGAMEFIADPLKYIGANNGASIPAGSLLWIETSTVAGSSLRGDG